MTENKIAESLINGYNILKIQDNKTIGYGTNMNKPEFKNCNFNLLKKILSNQGFTMNFENIRNHQFITIYQNL